MLQVSRLALIGAGKLGEALARGLIDAQAIEASRIVVTAGSAERCEQLVTQLGVTAAKTNRDAVRGADVVLLAVKPQQVGPVLDDLGESIDKDALLISVAASVSTSFIEKRLARAVPVVRAMPNTAALIKRAITGVSRGAHATPAHLEIARAIFSAVGRVVMVDEKHLDAITGLSASGLAFIYVVIESMAEGGVKMGLPRHLATELAAQTVLGAGAMVIETGAHPAMLKDNVTTPAGTTIDGLLQLEEGGLRVTLIKSVVQATQRARELLEK
ncbi:MAG: pyrroline-5-carboxylate reductase [Candidatus Eisenbacteria bacterium]|uniref:Pyrroline-5-carboxylate reductase n=1 Tax=Eiseniibacteriota bacterium TaxID=2212470 RepID=A0A849SSI6_UNCEI|nr:pyrroline-5-carboxylate reductase [Candidatus Eisenbacteria bacterium]